MFKRSHFRRIADALARCKVNVDENDKIHFYLVYKIFIKCITDYDTSNLGFDQDKFKTYMDKKVKELKNDSNKTRPFR